MRGDFNDDHTPIGYLFRGSKKYVWTEEDLWQAIGYVIEGQGEPLKM